MKNLYYIKIPQMEMLMKHEVLFMPIEDLVSNSEVNGRRCREIIRLLLQNFKTERKFCELWSHVNYVAIYEENDEVIGSAFISAPINWQIDYVVVRLDKRNQGIATSIVNTIGNEAWRRKVPYCILTSVSELAPLYRDCCGYKIIGNDEGS